MCEIKLATLNVNRARDFKKRLMLNELMKQKKLDIFMLQETHSDGGNAVEWKKDFEGLTVLSHNTSISAGVAVLFSKSFNPVSYVVDKVVKGRLLKVRAVFESYVLVFICIYAPTTPVERMIFLDLLCNTSQSCSEEEYLFLGVILIVRKT